MLRGHYREFIVMRGGRRYNPVLDNPNDERNIRHWTHGTADKDFQPGDEIEAEGYFQAWCQCQPCTEAGSRVNAQAVERRLEKKLGAKRAQLHQLLTERFPTAGTVEEGTDLVHSVHRVASRFAAKIVYEPAAVRLALRAWSTAEITAMPDAQLDAVASELSEEMNR
jgi:hypothetical protein